MAETVSNTTGAGGWDGDRAYSVDSPASWFELSGRAENGSDAGAFAFWRFTGGDVNYVISHRTILSGY
jgi:hypothetical protein